MQRSIRTVLQFAQAAGVAEGAYGPGLPASSALHTPLPSPQWPAGPRHSTHTHTHTQAYSYRPPSWFSPLRSGCEWNICSRTFTEENVKMREINCRNT